MPDFNTAAHPRAPLDDDRLLADFVESGDASVFGELFSRHTPLVYGLCLKYLGSVPDAEDAVMDIFEELIAKVGAHRIRNFRTWLWSVARNHCLQRLRREKRAVRVDFEDRVMESPPLLHLLTEGDDESALRKLEGCMGKLPEHQKEAVELFFIEKRSYADIAEATLGNIKSVKSYIQNGKRNLRICLERRGVKL